mmetsp:Transcript_31086/g.73895  ORF Transcript_31086/g.73895 Transcript_31086/m.73895 type:complete len:398 (-) Transcript_31086:1106-2299(-)
MERKGGPVCFSLGGPFSTRNRVRGQQLPSTGPGGGMLLLQQARAQGVQVPQAAGRSGVGEGASAARARAWAGAGSAVRRRRAVGGSVCAVCEPGGGPAGGCGERPGPGPVGPGRRGDGALLLEPLRLLHVPPHGPRPRPRDKLPRGRQGAHPDRSRDRGGGEPRGLGQGCPLRPRPRRPGAGAGMPGAQPGEAPGEEPGEPAVRHAARVLRLPRERRQDPDPLPARDGCVLPPGRRRGASARARARGRGGPPAPGSPLGASVPGRAARRVARPLRPHRAANPTEDPLVAADAVVPRGGSRRAPLPPLRQIQGRCGRRPRGRRPGALVPVPGGGGRHLDGVGRLGARPQARVGVCRLLHVLPVRQVSAGKVQGCGPRRFQVLPQLCRLDRVHRLGRAA